MDNTASDILKMSIYTVGCLEEIAALGGSNTNRDHDLTGETYHYMLRYEEPGREIVVAVAETEDDVTKVLMMEKRQYLLPRSGARFVVSSSFGKDGKPSIKFGWSPWLQERAAVVYVASAHDDKELVGVAVQAAEKLREEYFLRHNSELGYAPLKDMVLTKLIRR